MDQQAIKKLICEGSKMYGKKNANMSSARVDKVYETWFGDDQFHIEKDEVLVRLKDMFEAEQYPINEDCADCQLLGKVCYRNDHGLSHRIA